MKLQPVLNEYLIENRTLPLQEAGNLFFKENVAVVKEDGSTLLPPRILLEFSKEKPTLNEQEKLVQFISSKLSVSQEKAAKLLREEGSWQKAFVEAETAGLAPLGHFQKQEDGTISFVSADALNNYLPVIALKPNKQPEMEPVDKTNEPAGQEEVLTGTDDAVEQPPPQREKWWIWALVILAVSIALILSRYR